MTARGLTLTNAGLDGQVRSLRVQGAHIVALDVAAERGDVLIDLQGDRLLPGLINAHDHLQLNSFPALDYPRHYDNATAWIADVQARLTRDARLQASAAAARGQRYLGGGLKNLLSGVTTVAHHDPLDSALLEKNFPTGVLPHYGWSHSLHVDGELSVQAACRATPARAPWIIHAAEGLDAAARDEFTRLEALGCIRDNTLIVHGLGLDGAQRARLLAAGAGLIWCPSSNLRLFGRTAPVAELAAAGRVALGTDSRLTGARDLLDELRCAHGCARLDEQLLVRLVTSSAARLLRLPDRGVLEPGARADLLVLRAGVAVSRATRADVRLVVRGGAACYGEAAYVQAFSAHGQWREIGVDGHAKWLPQELSERLLRAQVREPGLEWPVGRRAALCG